MQVLPPTKRKNKNNSNKLRATKNLWLFFTEEKHHENIVSQ